MKTIGSIALLLLLLIQTGIAQDPPAPKPSGPIVALSLIVTDKDRDPKETISKDQVRIVEDKVEQTVLSVERDERPVDYGLLIDSSGSLRSSLASVIEAAKMIIVNRRESDEIFLERFISTNKIQKLHDFTTDNNRLLELLKVFRVEPGLSAVIDALYVGAEYVAQHKTGESRRKALVIITDGEDRNSSHNIDQLLNLLREKGIQVFVIGLVTVLDDEPNLLRQTPRRRAEKLLNAIAEETGGRVFYPATGPELVKAVTEIVADLRSQFRVTYQSTHSGKKGFHKVDVKLLSSNGEKRKIVVPRGYYAGS